MATFENAHESPGMRGYEHLKNGARCGKLSCDRTIDAVEPISAILIRDINPRYRNES